MFLKLDSYRNANKHVPASIFLWICTMKLKSLICLNHKDKLNLIPLKYSTGSHNNNWSNQNLNCINIVISSRYFIYHYIKVHEHVLILWWIIFQNQHLGCSSSLDIRYINIYPNINKNQDLTQKTMFIMILNERWICSMPILTPSCCVAIRSYSLNKSFHYLIDRYQTISFKILL